MAKSSSIPCLLKSSPYFGVRSVCDQKNRRSSGRMHKHCGIRQCLLCGLKDRNHVRCPFENLWLWFSQHSLIQWAKNGVNIGYKTVIEVSHPMYSSSCLQKVGWGKSVIALTLDGKGIKLLVETRCPKESIDETPNWHFSRLITRLWSCKRVKTLVSVDVHLGWTQGCHQCKLKHNSSLQVPYPSASGKLERRSWVQKGLGRIQIIQKEWWWRSFWCLHQQQEFDDSHA